jgi:hypothetical protein
MSDHSHPTPKSGIPPPPLPIFISKITPQIAGLTLRSLFSASRSSKGFSSPIPRTMGGLRHFVGVFSQIPPASKAKKG